MANHSCSIVIDDTHTDIVLNSYRNRIFVIVSQYQKFGSLITVSREVSVKDFQSETFAIKTIFGKDDIELHVAARYIAEQIGIDCPLLLSICLKNYDVATLKLIVQAINQIKTW